MTNRPPYHTNEELSEAVVGLVERASGRAGRETIGPSVEGRSIDAVTVKGPGLDEARRPRVLITANMHGNEVIGSEVALALLERLCAPELPGQARELLDLADVTVVPVVNPDGREASVTAWKSGWPGKSTPRCNRHGVDLNRNFPFPREARDVWYPLSGTRVSWLPWYRGAYPLSEPESAGLADLCRRIRPVAAVNLHSVGRYFLYPYCYTHREPADVRSFRAMGRAFIAHQERPYRVRQSRSWYAILGDFDDWLYDELGTLSVTVEVSGVLGGMGRNPLRLVSPFWWANPPVSAPTSRNDATACLAALAEGCRRAGSGLTRWPAEAI